MQLLVWITLLAHLPVLFASTDHGTTATCETLACQNGGTCVLELDGDYVCHCKLGYKGVLCDQAWLTEEKLTTMENTLKELSARVNGAQLVQLSQHGDILSLKHQLNSLYDCKTAVNWPRFFIPWTTLNFSGKVIDSCFLHIEKKLVVTLVLSSSLHVFQQSNQTNFTQIQSLAIPYAQSIVGLRVGKRKCFAVARSEQLPGVHEVKSLLYCWNASLNNFTIYQRLATRGASHVEYVTIGQYSFLILSCSRSGGNSSSLIYIYVWSHQRQQFLLYQYLPSNGAQSTKVISAQYSTYLVIDEVNQRVHTTVIYSWNGTYFSLLQLHPFKSGFVFAVGYDIFKISNSNMYRLDLNAKTFVVHSALPGSPNRNSTYNFFAVRNEFYLAESQYGQSGLLIHRMNGFDFTPYQNLLLQPNSYDAKVLQLPNNRVLLAVMYNSAIKLLKWSRE